MKKIAILCHGYNQVTYSMGMLKEIFSILHIQCVIYKSKNEIIARENTIYKIINTANPTWAYKFRGINFEKYITSGEIEKQYNILRDKIYKILN